MTDKTDVEVSPAPEDESTEALSAALSVHYIVLVLYALGTLGGAASTLLSFVTDTRINGVQVLIVISAPMLFIFHLLAVKGLKRAEPWGYTASKVLGYVLLLIFPLGTVLGAILLAQLSKFRFVNGVISVG